MTVFARQRDRTLRFGLRRKVGNVALIAMVTAAVVPLDTQRAAAAGPPNPITTVLAQGIDTLGQVISAGTAIEELTEAVPLTGIAPVLSNGLDVLNSLQGTLAQLQVDAEFLDEAPDAIADELEALDTTVGGVSVVVGCDGSCDVGETPVNVVDTAGVVLIELPIALTRTVATPLVFESDVIDIDGDNLSVDLAWSATMNLAFDTAIALTQPDRALSVSPFTATISAALTGGPVVANTRLGVADATATLDALAVAAALTSQFTDPDGVGGITREEWSNTTIGDLTTVARTGSVAGDLSIDTTLVAGSPDAGPFPIGDADLSDGYSFTLPAMTSLNPFTLISPEAIIAGIGQAAAALGGGQAVTDPPLPFLDGTVRKMVQAARPILDVVDSLGVICGTEGAGGITPAGSVEDLTIGTKVYCQGVVSSGVLAGSVVWDSPVASEDANASGASADPTLGLGAATNAEFTMTVDGDFDVTVTYTATFDDDNNPSTPATEDPGRTSEMPPRSVQELAAALDQFGAFDLLPEDIVQYDETTKALTFHLQKTFDPGAIDMPLSIGDQLEAGTGIVGLTTTDGSVTADASDVSIDITPGVLLLEQSEWDTVTGPGGCPDPELTPTQIANGECVSAIDLFFVQVNPTAPEFAVGDASFNVNAPTLVGQLGFLGITAEAGTFTVQRSNVAEPVLAVDLTPIGDMTVDSTPIPDAIRLRELLFEITDRVSVSDLNLKLDAGLTVTGTLNGTEIGSAGVTVAWDPVLVGGPTITADADLTELFSNFNPVPNLFGTHTGGDDEAVLTAGSANFPTVAVGARLENISDGSSCEVAATTATTLTCSEPLAGGDDNDWDSSDLYRLRVGSPLAMLEILLDNIDQIIAAIDNLSGGALGDALDTQLPLVDMSPRELLTQLQDLRRAIEEIRGTGAAVRCGLDDVTPAPTGDPGRIDLAAGATVDLWCNVFNPKGSSAVEWLTPTVLGFPDVTVSIIADGSDAATGGTEPTNNVHIRFENTGGDAVEMTQRTTRIPPDGSSEEYGYQIPVSFTDVDGEHNAEYPSLAQPTSIQALEDAIKDKLGISEGFSLGLDDTSVPGSNLVTLDIGIGRCNAETLCPGEVNMPDLSTSIGGSISGLGDLVSATSEGNVAVSYNADAHFALGLQLTGPGSPQVFVMPGTGIDLNGRFNGDDLNFTASLGPISVVAGTDAREASDNGTPEDTADDIPAGAGVFKLGADLQIGNVVSPVTLGDFFADLDTYLAPTFSTPEENDCGEVQSEGILTEDGADDVFVTLGGAGVIGCAALSIGLEAGGTVDYVADLGVAIDTNFNVTLVPDPPTDLLNALAAQALDLALLFRALPEILGNVEVALRATSSDAAGNGKLPLVGDALDAGADVVGALRDGAQFLVDNIDLDAVTDPDTGLRDAIAQFVYDNRAALDPVMFLSQDGNELAGPEDVIVITDCGGGPNSCAGESILSLVDVRVIFAIGQVVTTEIPFDLGLDGVPLRLVGGVKPQVNWKFVIDLGINKVDGPYMGVKDENGNDRTEMAIGAQIGLADNAAACSAVLDDPVAPLDEIITDDYDNDRCLGGQLAFLGVQVRDSTTNPTQVALEVGLDVQAGGDEKLTLANIGSVSLEPVVGLDANIDVRFRTGIAADQAAGFPEVVGTFSLTWGWALGDPLEAPEVGFDNLYLNIEPLVGKFLEPITDEVRKITGPFKPVIDTLTAPIPVVSDLAEMVGKPPVTLLALMEVISGNDLSLIQSLAAFITFINDSPIGDGYIPLGGGIGGGFTVNAAKSRKAQGPTDAGKLVENAVASAASLWGATPQQSTSSNVASKAAAPTAATKANLPGTFGVPGLTFPFMDNPSQVFGLLMGQDITLVRYDVGPLKATAGFSYNFPPIMVGPVPIAIGVGGSVTVKGRFVIGYDTSGLRKVLSGGSGVHLFDGIFLDDLDINGVDVPEISFIGEVYAQAGVTVGIASAGIVAGLRITVDLNLDDSPEPDGKLHIEEIFNKLQNPICLFEVSGKLEAFIKAFVELNLFITSIRFDFTLLEIELLNFSGKCSPPKPVLAELKPNGELWLNIGPRTSLRNVAPDTVDEEVIVRPVSNDGTYAVSAFGVYQTYGPSGEFKQGAVGVSKVIGDGAGGKDKLQMLAGADQEAPPANPDSGNAVTPAVIAFTAELDLQGGDDNDVVIGGDANDTIDGGNGDDRIEGGKGGDTLYGSAGIDTLNGQDGGDTMDGGADADKLQGGPGNDRGLGGDGIDILQGGPGTGGASDDGNDTLIGGNQADAIDGGNGNDALYGDDEVYPSDAATCDADTPYNPGDPNEAADKISGGLGDDVVVGGAGPDELFGGSGNDSMCGNQGDDKMDGDQADDPSAGVPGDDSVRGGANSDDIVGGGGHDLVVGGLNTDVVSGGAGNDDVVGGVGRDLVRGNDGRDVIVGDNAAIDQSAAKATRGLPATSVSLVTAIGSAADAGAAPCLVSNDRATSADAPSTDTGAADCVFGDVGEDLIFGEGGNDQMFAGDGNDLVYAGDGDDNPVRGELGDDVMHGEAGLDTMFGDDGADRVFGNADTDVIRGGIGDDYIEGNGANDTLYGEAAQDDIIGGTSADGGPDAGDYIEGGAASDVVVGDNGTVTRPGGTDVDGSVLRAVALHDVGDPSVGGGDTIYGGLAGDQVWGGNGADSIDGEQGIDRLEGNDGTDDVYGDFDNDRIVGGSSSRATLIGADGVTLVSYDNAPDQGDQLYGEDGDDVIVGDNATIAYDGVTTMTGADLGSGVNFGDDTIAGGIGQDRLYGQLGDDAITGGDDEDYAIGDLGAITPGAPLGTWPGGAPKYDVRLEITPDNGGNDDVDGGLADDHLFGGAANDVLRGQFGDDYVEGNNGQDSIYGLAPDTDTLGVGDTDQDDLIGGTSSWTRPGSIARADVGELIMQGNADRDVMTGDNATIDRITDGPGTSWAFDEVIPGARKRGVSLLDRERSDLSTVSGGDVMVGNSGSDRMFGEGGGDSVKGNDDDDLLEGNQGSDWLEGNSGEDDVVGGSSFLASAGGLALGGAGSDLGDPDETDAVFGGSGADVLAGDNAVIIRKTAGNASAYTVALATAYATTDPNDAVPGWWLGVTTHRLVRLLDRTALNNGRSGADLISGGTGTDVGFAQDGDDWVTGGFGDDTIEGNGGADTMLGDRTPTLTDAGAGEPVIAVPVAPGSSVLERDGGYAADGEDDIVGGSNVSHRDGGDLVEGDGEDDFVLGDNGTLQRNIVSSAYVTYPGVDNARWMRRATRLDTAATAASGVWGADMVRGNAGDDAMWGQDGDDTVYGQADNDDLFGELGNDTIYGGLGEDAMIGDRGGVVNSKLAKPGALFSNATYSVSYNGPPFLTYTGMRPGTLDRRVDLAIERPGSVGGPFVGQPQAVLTSNGVTAGGADTMRGGPGHDSLHGAFGDDLMNGDSGGDALFGSDGSDVMWGGRGSNGATPDDRGVDDSLVDYVFGGRGGNPATGAGIITGGADIIDYLPRVTDPAAWHTAIAAYDDLASGGETIRQHHQGIDWMYGGWDRDVMESNVADNGPNFGDRALDWTGSYNLYVQCPSNNGGYNDIRAMSPAMISFLENLAYSLGVGTSIADVRSSNSSAYRELAMVYKPDVKANSSKAYPTTPGHFEGAAACTND